MHTNCHTFYGVTGTTYLPKGAGKAVIWLDTPVLTLTIGKYFYDKFVKAKIDSDFCDLADSLDCVYPRDVLPETKDQLLHDVRGYGRENCTVDGKTGMPTLRPVWPSYEKLVDHKRDRMRGQTVIFDSLYGHEFLGWKRPKPEIWKRQC
jgi:hypothetical protein